MKIKIQSVHFDADVKLLNFVENRMNKLEQFYDSIIGAEVILRIDNAENSENKVAEVKLLAPGVDLFSKRQAKSFEEAVDQASEALERQLKKKLGKEKK
jgi:putative sigma-54 modulation protein